MSDRLFTAIELDDKIRELAAGDPSHVYHRVNRSDGVDDSCRYAAGRDGVGWEHGCIVGQAIHNLALSLTHNDDGDIVLPNGHLFSTAYDSSIEPESAIYFPDSPFAAWVQTYQDAGKSWSEAVHLADQKLEAAE